MASDSQPGDDRRERETDLSPTAGDQATAVAAKPRRRKRARAGGQRPARRVSVGDLLGGRYRLTRVLSEGAMGSVFVARNEVLEIDVAVKLVRADLDDADEASLAERLQQEAQAAAQLGHPAIVGVHDLGTAATGDPYIVMDLLEGEDLAAALERRGRVSPAKAVRLLLPIAHALAAAHEKQIVHRDLKPDNIFLAHRDGRVQPMLIDFGVARLRNRAGQRITQLGVAVGTPDYMSPEQALGQDVEATADIWAFCVVLYRMITGQLPFVGRNSFLLLRAITKDDPKPLTELGVRDKELAAIVQRGLAKKRPQRWQSMRELGRALAIWLVDHGVSEDICGQALESVWLSWRPTTAGEAFDSVPPPVLRDRDSAPLRPKRARGRRAKAAPAPPDSADDDRSRAGRDSAPPEVRPPEHAFSWWRAWPAVVTLIGLGCVAFVLWATALERADSAQDHNAGADRETAVRPTLTASAASAWPQVDVLASSATAADASTAAAPDAAVGATPAAATPAPAVPVRQPRRRPAPARRGPQQDSSDELLHHVPDDI